jgi:hypothetical protein
LELEKELNDGDAESSNVKPVNIFQQSNWLNFLSISTLPLASEMITMPTGKKLPKLP